jgi:hypothetical protein
MTDLQGMILSGLIAVIICRLRSDRDTRATLEPLVQLYNRTLERINWRMVAIVFDVVLVAVTVGLIVGAR